MQQKNECMMKPLQKLPKIKNYSNPFYSKQCIFCVEHLSFGRLRKKAPTVFDQSPSDKMSILS